MDDRNFYHSFPRVRPDDGRQRTVQVGLAILRSMREIGLVLAPEVVVWKQPLQNGEHRTVNVLQHRICFTELARSEVAEHGKKFGQFAIELRTDALRRLGGLPVIYMPQHLKDDRNLSGVGSAIIAQSADILYTMRQLQNLLQATDPTYVLRMVQDQGQPATSVADDYVFDLQNTDPANMVVAQYRIPAKTIRDFLGYISYRNAPFGLMVGVLSLVQNLFYPTDDAIHDRQMEYYRQREWRLVAGLALPGWTQSQHLTEAEKRLVSGIDERFWTKEIKDENRAFRRVDDAFVIKEFQGQHVTAALSSIIVPAEAESEARALFGEKVAVATEC